MVISAKSHQTKFRWRGDFTRFETTLLICRIFIFAAFYLPILHFCNYTFITVLCKHYYTIIHRHINHFIVVLSTSSETDLQSFLCWIKFAACNTFPIFFSFLRKVVNVDCENLYFCEIAVCFIRSSKSLNAASLVFKLIDFR